MTLTRILRKIIGYGLLIYLVFGAYMYLTQRQHIYFPDRTSLFNHPKMPTSYKPVQVKLPDTVQIYSWYSPAEPGKHTLIHFQGNSGNILSRIEDVRGYTPRGYGMAHCGYPGYGGNRGNMRESDLYAACRGLLEKLIQQGVKEDQMVFFGESLGTAVAVQMATEYSPAAVILQSPFTSLTALASARYPMYPVSYLMDDKYDSLSKIKKVKAPLLILHGEKDTLVPIAHGKRLYEAANKPKFFYKFPLAKHNNMINYHFNFVILDFLSKVTG